MDAVFHNSLSEVDDHTELVGCQPQVRQELGLEDAVVNHNGLAFDDDLAAHNEVDSKRRGKFFAFVRNRESHLPVYGQSALLQFPYQGFFVDTFEKARPAQRAVDFNGTFDNVAANLVFV